MIEPGSEAAKELGDYAANAREQTADANMRAVNNRAEINRLRAALAEIVRVGTWTGTDERTYASHEAQIARAILGLET